MTARGRARSTPSTRPASSTTGVVDELSDKAIAARVEHGSKLPTPQGSMHLYPIDAAVHRVASGDSAFAYRDSRKKEYDPGNLFRINQNIQPAE